MGGLVVLGFLHLILEKRCVIKLVRRLKSQSLHGSGNASIGLAYAIFVQPSDLCILLHQVIISYMLFFLQYLTCLGKVWEVTEAVKCY